MLTGEIPEELVMPVRQRLVAGEAVARAVKRNRALVDYAAVAGRRPRLDCPGHRLAGVEIEGIKVKHAYVRLIALVAHRGGGAVDLDIAVVALRGLAMTRGTRDRLRARAGHPERQGQAGRGHHRADRKAKFNTP